MERVHAVGVDLAWGRNPSGVAHLIGAIPDGGARDAWRLVESRTLASHDAVAAWVSSRVPQDEPAWIAVDASLVANNPKGTERAAETAFKRTFLRHRVSVYPTDRESAALTVAFRQTLERAGWICAPPGPASEVRRGVFETFPTGAQLSLFELRRPIRYKRGPRAARVDGLRSLQLHLAGLDDAALPLAETGTVKRLLRTDPATLPGAELKALEDELDALICALVAALAWSAPRRLLTFGEPADGFITVPHPPAAP